MKHKPRSVDPAGFRRTSLAFSIPENLGGLDPVQKRQFTICNLFCNHQQSVDDIVRLLDEPLENVVKTLLTRELIFDRRKGANTPRDGDRRRLPSTENPKKRFSILYSRT